MKQFNLGIIYANRKLVKRILKVLKEKGIDPNTVGGVYLIERREDKKHLPFFMIGDMTLKLIKEISFEEMLPEGWDRKKSLKNWFSSLL